MTTAISEFPTTNLEQAVRVRETAAAKSDRAAITRQIACVQADLAEREKRVCLLLKTYDLECAMRRLGRLSNVAEAEERLTAERKEVVRHAAALRGLKRALEIINESA